MANLLTLITRSSTHSDNGVNFAVGKDKKDVKIAPGKVEAFFIELANRSHENEVFSPFRDKTVLYERCKTFAPLSIDVDIVCDDSDHDIPDHFPTAVIFYCQELLRKHFPKLDGEHMQSIVLKSASSNMRYMSIRFPFVRVSIDFFNKTFKRDLEKLLRVNKIIDLLNFSVSEDWNSMINDMSEYVGVYGFEPKMLEFSESCGIVTLIAEDEEFESENVELPAPHHHCWVSAGMISSSVFDEDPAEKWLSIILSPTYTHRKLIKEEDTTSVDGSSVIALPECDISSKEPTSVILFLLPLVSKERVNDYATIGQCLYNIFDGSSEGLDLWREWSGSDSAEKEWFKFSRTKGVRKAMGLRTIAEFVLIDDPEGYNMWHRGWMDKAIEKCFGFNQQLVSDAIYRFFWLTHICTDPTSDTWYSFCRKTHYMKKSVKAVHIAKDISDKFIPYLLVKRREYSDASTRSDLTAADQKTLSDKIKLISTLADKLGGFAFKSGVLKFCREQFYDQQANALFNTNPFTMAWQNGVSEIIENEGIRFRPGRMDDYITKSTFMRIEEDMHESHPLMIELMAWLNKVYPTKELLHFFLKICASFLYGENADRMLLFWIGVGANSKSMIAKLLKAVFSTYFVDFPVSVFCAKKMGNSSLAPELVQAIGAHGAIISEPDYECDLDAGALKRITGGDGFFARGCYQDGGTINPSFTPIIMCNKIPGIVGKDGATDGRIVILPHLSVFCANPPSDPEEQVKQRRFKRDVFFGRRIDELAVPMAWLIFQYYPKYVEEGLEMPDIVSENTTQHLTNTNPYKVFVTTCLTRIKDSKGNYDLKVKMNASTMFQAFKVWTADAFPRMNKISLEDFKEEMIKLLGPQFNRSWPGVAFTEESENDE